jgi:glycosyltransferase involved in cell wall biosynthesis
MTKKKIILTVINDLLSDQRMNKVCLSLTNDGYEVHLLGTKFKNTHGIAPRKYKTLRFRMIFRRGFLFYAEYNLRLFIYLLFSKHQIVVSNDLDTLLAGYLATLLTQKKLVYDSHEYFTEVPELIGRNARKVWLMIERFILPKVKHSYTVCQSIASEYKQLYNVDMKVVRNFPLKEIPTFKLNKSEFFGEKKIILYQGALNVGRGLEYVIRAMKNIENAVFVIIGDGDIKQQLKQLTIDLHLSKKVMFLSKMSFTSLFSYTQMADVGIALQEDRGLSYRYVLPNRLFDYIKAQIPVLISDLPEMSLVLKQYDIGHKISDFSIMKIAQILDEMLNDEAKRQIWKENLKLAAQEYTWENEEKELLSVYNRLILSSQ